MKIVKYYPDHFDLHQAQAYVAYCKRLESIPPHAKLKTKRIYRKKLVRLTWRW